MSVISNIVLEELQRNLRLQENYKQRLSLYKKGSLVRKVRNNKNYYYLSFRDSLGKPKYKYVGVENSQFVLDCKNSIENYNYFNQQIKHLKSEEKDMRKMLKAVKERIDV